MFHILVSEWNYYCILIKPSATCLGHMLKCAVTKKVFIAIVVQYLCPLRKNQCFSCGIMSGESGLSIALTLVAIIIDTTAEIGQATLWAILRTAFILLDVVTTRPIQVWTAQQFLMLVDLVAVIHGH